MSGPALIILAAGAASRFGAPKQLTPVGPTGDVLFDYAASDASAAGFDLIVIVTRSELEPDVESHIRARWPRHIDVRIVCQDRDQLALAAPGRHKPLGTVHAALVGIRAANRSVVGVVNGDDLYGSEPYRLLATHVSGGPPPVATLVTFPVSKTVIGTEKVTRALCAVRDGRLRAIDEGEVHGTEWTGRSGRRVRLVGDEPVSMNFWGLAAHIADQFEDLTRGLVDAGGDAEVLLPDVVRSRIADGDRIDALAYDGPCIGLTHPADLARVRRMVTTPAW
ncbi:MAG TPA: NTP transferase domain-containing protein [Acidimicrobiales bacterium]|nr:NTP transferase domain-containing protein [Acidimicrobiales bacterium]